MRVAPVFTILAVAATTAHAIGGCSAFAGDDGAPSMSDGGDESLAVPMDADASSAPDAAAPPVVCVPEPPWPEPDSGERYATCDGGMGIDLLASPEDCGRCGHSCAPEACQRGRCVARVESSEGDGVGVVGTVGSDVYFRAGYYLLKRLAPGGGPVLLADLNKQFDAAAGTGFRYILGGVTSAGGTTWLRTRAVLFSLDGGDLSPVADLVDNDVPEYLATTSDGVFVSARDSILRVPFGADAAAPEQATGPMLYLTARNDAVYWIEQPWNTHAGGTAGSTAATLIKRRRAGGAVTLVHTGPERLTGIFAQDDGVYFMRLGAGGGIIRLPLDATLSTVPEQLAADDGLSEDTPYLTADATHVYWTRPDPADPSRVTAELWKRAKCGGASVRLGSIVLARGLVSRGTRLYFGRNTDLMSIAK